MVSKAFPSKPTDQDGSRLKSWKKPSAALAFGEQEPWQA